ncbi:hypothetical protein GF336_04930 [Candidatus Woesearchaeota archaeon]|nr:hypothetical protein [Candidatus Woesearchaeota archaeon]
MEKKRAYIIIELIVGFTIIYYLGLRLYKSWSQLQNHEFSLNVPLFIFSLLLLCLGFFIMSYSWRFVLLKMGKKINMKSAFYIWAVSGMGKYLPGMVWPAAGRMYLIKKDRAKNFLSFLVEQGIKVMTAFAIALVFIYPFLRFVNIYWAVLFFAISMIVMHPRIFNMLLSAGFSLLKRKKKKIELRYSDLLKTAGLLLLAWIVIGFGFSVMVISLYDINLYLVPFLIGSFALAWAAGFLFLITPAGLGVREGVIVLILQHFTPVPVAIVISLAARIWWSLGDISAYAIARIVKKFS